MECRILKLRIVFIFLFECIAKRSNLKKVWGWEMWFAIAPTCVSEKIWDQKAKEHTIIYKTKKLIIFLMNIQSKNFKQWN